MRNKKVKTEDELIIINKKKEERNELAKEFSSKIDTIIQKVNLDKKNGIIFNDTDGITSFLESIIVNNTQQEDITNNQFICLQLIRQQDGITTYRFFRCDKVKPKRITTATVSDYIINLAKELQGVNIYIALSTYYIQNKKYWENYKKKTDDDKFKLFNREANSCVKCSLLFCDLDSYKTENYKSFTPMQLWDVIQEENKELLKELDLQVVCSGGGLQIYLRTESSYFKDARQLNNFKLLSTIFNNIFMDYGSDSHCTADITRIFRAPGSYNWKKEEPRKCQIIKHFNDTTYYSQQELIEIFKKYIEFDYAKYQYLNLEKEEEQIFKDYYDCDFNSFESNDTKYKKILLDQEKNYDDYDEFYCLEDEKPSFTHLDIVNNLSDRKMFYSEIGKLGYKQMIKNRSNDIYQYCKNRNWKIGAIGERNSVLYCYFIILYNSYKADLSSLFNKLKSLNSLFDIPFSEDELVTLFNYLVKKKYGKITNEKIMNELNFTEKDIKTFKSSYTDEELKRKQNLRKKRSRENLEHENILQGKIPKDELVKERLIDLKYYIKKNKTNAEMAELLGVSIPTIIRYKQKLK